MAVLKLTSIGLLTIIFFWLFVFGPLYHHMVSQAGALIVVFGWHTKRFTFRETISVIKFCFPFLMTLFLFGLLFHFIRLQGREDWLADTAVKCMVFPSSLIFLKVLLTYISYLDILQLPISMKRRIDLITMKSAFRKGGTILKRFSWYLNTYPGMHGGHRIRNELVRYACLIIALYLYLYEEIENSSRLLKNRYHHLIKENK